MVIIGLIVQSNNCCFVAVQSETSTSNLERLSQDMKAYFAKKGTKYGIEFI